MLVNHTASDTVRSGTVNSVVATAASRPNPLDQVSSAQIALHAAQMTQIAQLTAVRNQADSEKALLAIVPNDTTLLAKPQIVTTSQKSKYDIVTYTTQAGDTVDSIANKFNLTLGSITGSNGLAGTAVSPGKVLLIPPANGIAYKIQAGDTVDKIVNRYGADRNLFIAVNDAEKELKPGEHIWIPNVTQPGLSVSYVPRAATVSHTPIYGYNGYDYGFCTWYVASRIAVPSNWGNANTWDDYARHTAGWVVSLTPVAGAIGQSNAGWAGHVGVVDAVSEDGTMIKYSDMNGVAGWGRVGSTDWVSASRYNYYIFKQ